MSDAIALLAERAAVADAVTSYTNTIDTRDWALMRTQLTPTVHIDYSSMGSLAGDMPAEAWIARLQSLHGFDATLHNICNLVVSVNGDRATCTSHVNAYHYLEDGGEELQAFANGTYIHELVRVHGKWLVCKAVFKMAGMQSGKAMFARAFARARELAPQRMKAGG